MLFRNASWENVLSELKPVFLLTSATVIISIQFIVMLEIQSHVTRSSDIPFLSMVQLNYIH